MEKKANGIAKIMVLIAILFILFLAFFNFLEASLVKNYPINFIRINVIYNSSTNLFKDPFLEKYSYTKAICDEKNYCQDYEIFCINKQVIEITPISGAAVQFSDDWDDPRTLEQREKSCE